MNKLIFGEGGQPIYLDDLNLIHDNMFYMWSKIFGTMSGGTPFLLSKPSFKNADVVMSGGEAVGIKFDVLPNTIFVSGALYEFDGATIEVAAGDVPFYICIKRNEEGHRVFYDGQSRPCMENGRAYLCTTKEGADEYYEYYSTPSLSEVLSQFISNSVDDEWADMEVDYKNGFSGSVQLKQDASGIYLRINITSSQKSITDGYDIFVFKNNDIISSFGTQSSLTGGIITHINNAPYGSPCWLVYDKSVGAVALWTIRNGQPCPALGYLTPDITINATFKVK